MILYGWGCTKAPITISCVFSRKPTHRTCVHSESSRRHYQMTVWRLPTMYPLCRHHAPSSLLYAMRVLRSQRIQTMSVNDIFPSPQSSIDIMNIYSWCLCSRLLWDSTIRGRCLVGRLPTARVSTRYCVALTVISDLNTATTTCRPVTRRQFNVADDDFFHRINARL